MNNLIDKIIQSVNLYSGIEFESKIVPDSETRLNVQLRDSRITKGMGFILNLKLLNARVQVDVGFESVAKKILHHSFNRIKSNSTIIEKFLSSNEFVRDLDFFCNNQKTLLSEIGSYDENDINDLRLELFTSLIDLENIEEVLEKVFTLIVPLLLLLLPYEEEDLGQIEGQSQEILTTKYERSKKNRTLCLSYYGYDCQACNINMEDIYGPIGKEFIHVHHIEPISLTGVKKINPFVDLIPLCPNCHSIVHRKSPPLSIESLRKIINNEQSSK